VAGFRYLVSDTVSLENVDEAEALRNTLDAMSIVGLSQQEQVAHAATLQYMGFMASAYASKRISCSRMHLIMKLQTAQSCRPHLNPCRSRHPSG